MEEYLEYWKRAFDYKGKTDKVSFQIPFYIFCLTLLGTVLFSFSKYYWIILICLVGINLLPLLSITTRRLRDANNSFLNLLWFLVPVIGWIILFTYCIQDTVTGVSDNTFNKMSEAHGINTIRSNYDNHRSI